MKVIFFNVCALKGQLKTAQGRVAQQRHPGINADITNQRPVGAAKLKHAGLLLESYYIY